MTLAAGTALRAACHTPCTGPPSKRPQAAKSSAAHVRGFVRAFGAAISHGCRGVVGMRNTRFA